MSITRTIQLALLIAAAAPVMAQTTSSGKLTLTPAAHGPGARVEARYQGDARFAGATRLVLRARLRTPGDQEAYVGAIGTETRRVAELVRGDDGVLRGSFQWPDSVVYALFAVEAPDGGVIDTHGNQGWELMERGAGGRPTARALTQRAGDLTLRNPLLGLETAREGARLYPDDPASWMRLWWFEGYAQGRRETDSASLQPRRARFAQLARALQAKASLTGDEVGAMMYLARGLRDEEAATTWEARLLREHPRHRDAVPARMTAAMAPHSSSIEGKLAVLEPLWAELGTTDDYLLMVGTENALSGGDPAAVVRWTDRLLAHVPLIEAQSRAARAVAERPATRAEGMRHIRRILARLDEARDADRDLFRTAPQQRDRAAEHQAELLAALGHALGYAGAVPAALDTLRAASSRSARIPLLREIATAQLAAGDTAGAASSWARATGAGAGTALADSVRGEIGARFVAERWAGEVAAARAEFAARVRRAEISRPLAGGLRLVDGAGAPAALRGSAAGRPTVVVFAKSGCGFSLRALPRVERMAAELARSGVRTVLVTDEAPSEDLQKFFGGRGYTGPVLFDPSRSTHAAFGSAGTPEYFVVDGAGMIRFEYSSLDELPSQVAALARP
ncbi:MAG TPA: redoxin family protein [Longimicrobium sp.]|jgi:thiol-disulfide isomerase/thioredoxin